MEKTLEEGHSTGVVHGEDPRAGLEFGQFEGKASWP